MAAEDRQFSVVMSYDTCGEDARDAVLTMLTAIEARSSVFITVHEDGQEHPEAEGEFHDYEITPEPSTEPSSPLRETAKEYAFDLSEEQTAALTNDEWQALDRMLMGLGAYDTDFFMDRILFSLPRGEWHQLQSITDTIQEELDRMTGATTTRALEALDGYGSF